MKLYMLVLGAEVPGRFTEQHDVFFGIGTHLSDLVVGIKEHWPEAGEKIHIDSYREVNKVDTYRIEVIPRAEKLESASSLYFLNMGGYKPNDLEEYHYKVLVIAQSLEEAIEKGKQAIFFKHHNSSHLDNKYGVDVDDVYDVEEMLPAAYKEKYGLKITPSVSNLIEDQFMIGYVKLSELID